MENKQCFECCDKKVIHKEAINKVNEYMMDIDTLNNLTKLFKTIADPTRIKILWALDKSELCVCDISELLQMSSSAISHQLRVLKEEGLVKNRKSGKNVFYSLKDEHVKQLYNIGLIHTNE